jgi:hypothetical protein
MFLLNSLRSVQGNIGPKMLPFLFASFQFSPAFSSQAQCWPLIGETAGKRSTTGCFLNHTI